MNADMNLEAIDYSIAREMPKQFDWLLMSERTFNILALYIERGAGEPSQHFYGIPIICTDLFK